MLARSSAFLLIALRQRQPSISHISYTYAPIAQYHVVAWGYTPAAAYGGMVGASLLVAHGCGGGLCRARHEICDATILLHRMHSNNIFCCSASWPVSCRSDGHVFGIPTGEVSRMDGSGGTVIAAVLYCTGHGLSAPAVGCLLLSSDAIALFDAAASGHSCCCENRTSNDLLLGANIILSIQFVPPHLPLQSPPSHYPPSTFAPARGRSGRYFFVYFGFVDWIPEQQQQQQQQQQRRQQQQQRWRSATTTEAERRRTSSSGGGASMPWSCAAHYSYE